MLKLAQKKKTKQLNEKDYGIKSLSLLIKGQVSQQKSVFQSDVLWFLPSIFWTPFLPCTTSASAVQNPQHGDKPVASFMQLTLLREAEL